MAAPLPISEYTYHLPDDRIAYEPLAQRDHSKLLVYQSGNIIHSQFFRLVDHLPVASTLFFNDTKVIAARLLFQKESGAIIECFLLNPVLPTSLVAHAMTTTETSTWRCTIGNLKRWPNNLVLSTRVDDTVIEARLVDRENGLVQFNWTPGTMTFGLLIDRLGKTPLPPYIKREAKTEDRQRYQTVYAAHEGAVAAPTAGLHFTPAVMETLGTKQIEYDFLTLHVGAGTFQPVKVENAIDHTMHEEQLIVTERNIDMLLAERPLVAVGTTSLRVMESLYWFGVQLSRGRDAVFHVRQDDPYTLQTSLTKRESLQLVKQHLKQTGATQLHGSTAIFIHPGYQFRVADALITNFHQPCSTLMLLVAAFVGPAWREIYQEALANQYRFLSYGDSSLLFKSND